jgi:glucose/arabinose dehydrogenase
MIHPETGALWNKENGRNGGDEINLYLLTDEVDVRCCE